MSLILVIFSGFVLAIFAPFMHRVTGRVSGWLLAIHPLMITVYLVTRIPSMEYGSPLKAYYPWFTSYGINLSFVVDGLALLFMLLISGIGTLVIIYGGGYLAGHPLQGRFYSYILVFMAAMLGLVAADNIFLMFIFWELTSFSSYLLIGFNHEDEKSRKWALQALLVTGGGGLVLLAGLLLLSQIGGATSFSDLMDHGEIVRDHAHYIPLLFLILIGAFTKSAQTPFHFWLPNAMAAPTPVSAYLHSATMVKAGVYLLARLNPVIGGTVEWHYLVTLAGASTMMTGALLALPQTDLKRLLAYTTISALGTLVMLFGLSTELATKAAIVFLIVHALYKGALFMVAGIIDHATGTRDVKLLGALLKIMPVTALAAGLAALSMSGLPPLLGFVGKELLYEAKLQAPNAAFFILLAGILANLVNVTVAIITGIAPFLGKKYKTPDTPHEAKMALLVGPLILGFLGLTLGLFPSLIGDSLIAPAVSGVRAEQTIVKLKLWHGINPVFLLSLMTVLFGVVFFFLRNGFRGLAEKIPYKNILNLSFWYQKFLDGTMATANIQTRLLQHGYQRYYIKTILLVLTCLVGYTLLRQDFTISWVNISGITFYEITVFGIILVAAFFVLRIQSRLAAVAMLSVVGYGIAIIFVLYGAPDLAITQILIETLTVILLVFLLYFLPPFVPFSGPKTRIIDALIAITAGTVMTTLVLQSVNIQLHQPISQYYAQNSYLKAQGRNIVNVILVDFRALDTLGEITVLGIAALGVYALINLKTRKSKKL